MEEEKNLIPEEEISTPAEEEISISTEEVKKPNFVKPIIIAVCVLAAFAAFYFGMQHFADNKPAGIPVGGSSATGEPVQTNAPAPSEQTKVPTPSEQTTAPTVAPIQSPIPVYTETPSLKKELTFEEAMDICQKVAAKHLGEGTLIIPDFDAALIEVTFDGKTRPCYVFIGGSVEYMLGSREEEPPARYVVDITNGDVFDTISKLYIK